MADAASDLPADTFIATGETKTFANSFLTQLCGRPKGLCLSEAWKALLAPGSWNKTLIRKERQNENTESCRRILVEIVSARFGSFSRRLWAAQCAWGFLAAGF